MSNPTPFGIVDTTLRDKVRSCVRCVLEQRNIEVVFSRIFSAPPPKGYGMKLTAFRALCRDVQNCILSSLSKFDQNTKLDLSGTFPDEHHDDSVSDFITAVIMELMRQNPSLPGEAA